MGHLFARKLTLGPLGGRLAQAVQGHVAALLDLLVGRALLGRG